MIEIQDWTVKIGNYYLSLYDDENLWISEQGGKGVVVKERDFVEVLKRLHEENK